MRPNTQPRFIDEESGIVFSLNLIFGTLAALGWLYIMGLIFASCPR